jgi:ATP-dependent RNA circularization protein (DNA/RNA ligase family)
MMEYPKIQTIWKRDEGTKKKLIMEGQYSKPEISNIKQWYITEKIDGANVRVEYTSIPQSSVTFSGRTDNSQLPSFLFDYLKNKFTPELMAQVFPFNETDPEPPYIILFGEGYGKKIQKDGENYKPDGVGFILFDIYINDWWLEQDKVREIAIKLGIDVVPDVGVMTIDEAVAYLKTKPKSKISQREMIAEGIVARSHPLVLYRNGTPIMWKLKVKDYDAGEASL